MNWRLIVATLGLCHAILSMGALPREAVDAEIAIAAQVVRIESVIPLPDDFERRNPIPEPKRPNTPEPKPSPVAHCDCGGSGFVTDKANWKRVRCECGKPCKCKTQGLAPPDSETVAAVTNSEPKAFKRDATTLAQSRPQQRANRGVMVSAKWCGPCGPIKTKEIPELEKATWLVNKGPQSHLVVMDYDDDSGMVAELLELPGAPERITSLPTFFRITGNKIVDTHEGAMDANQIARFVYPSLKQEAGEPEKSAPGGGNQAGQVCPRCGKVHGVQQYQTQPQQSGSFLFWSW